MIDSLSDVLTVKTLLGLIGSFPGGLRAYVLSRANHSRARALSDMMIGAVFAASVAEMLTPNEYPAAALMVGLFAGLAGGRTLDALFELVPEVVRTIALGWARKIVGEGAENKLKQVSGWGPLEPTPPSKRKRRNNPDDMET